MKTEGQAGGPGERQSLYFPKEILEEIKAEALRQDRSLSWIIQKAWQCFPRDVFEEIRAESIRQERPMHVLVQKAWQLAKPRFEQQAKRKA